MAAPQVPFDDECDALCQRLAGLLEQRGWMLATAESCTGGMIAAACTSLAGSSNWFERGFVTYSNEAKCGSLGVAAGLIAQHGAVSEQVARAMAAGAVRQAPVQVSVAVTGIAGPSGGSASKPVGTVWFGFQAGGQLISEVKTFPGDRRDIRQASVRHALGQLIKLLTGISPVERNASGAI